MNQLKTTILNGKKVAEKVLTRITTEVNSLKSSNKRIPGLAVILIGDNPASHAYVRNKEKACKNVGFHSEIYHLGLEISETQVAELIESLNQNNKIDGVLIQLPLPAHIKLKNLMNILNPDKDVDGLHPYNLGKLASGQDSITPCTPRAVIEILDFYNINVTGTNSVIIGRSNLVGKPLALLLLNKNATVTIAHSKSKDLEGISRKADLLISAVGKPNLVTETWVKPGAIVIDVGINKINIKEKSILVGDVAFEGVSKIASAITPVPGGVGPVTVAMLMQNTLAAYIASSS